MADLITLNCPTCGGNLQVTNDVERFVCAHCGNTHIVDPGVRVKSLASEVEKLSDESRLRHLEREIGELDKQGNLLRAEIDEIRFSGASVGSAYRLGIAAAFVTSVVLLMSAILELVMRRSGSAGGLALLAVIIIGLGAVATRVYPTINIVPNHDAQLQKLAVIERQIAQKQRELETLQRRLDSLAGNGDDSVNSDTQHALRISTS